MVAGLGPMPPEIITDRPGWHPARIATVAIILVMVIFWIWVFAGGPDRHNPDYLSDRAWVNRAKLICTADNAKITALPGAETAPNAKARSKVIEEADADLTHMINQLAAQPPDNASDTKVVDHWLYDYRRYVGNRQQFAQHLLTDPHAELLLDQEYGQPLDDVITTFALDGNNMGVCEAPGDIG
jgi:hypothetical protein